MNRTTFSLSPLFRSTVGFDNLNDLFNSVLDSDDNTLSYPPYNIEKKGEDNYKITMAVAGFKDSDISITSNNNELVIAGNITEKSEEDNVEYLHKGIATRSFQRNFKLADHMIVTGADLNDGLLKISLVRELPEEKKPRMIPINNQKLIDNKKSKH